MTTFRQLISALLLCVLGGGCAAVTNPAMNGIPVRLLPPELLAPPREPLESIPLSYLGMQPPKVYRLAAGDTLGVYIEGVLPANAREASNPPVYFPSQINSLGRGLPPTLGFPLPVLEDGTVRLPLIDPVNVENRSVADAEELIRKTYIDKGILQAGRERLAITLMQPRQIRVVVLRQEVGGFASGTAGFVATTTSKRGTGHLVDLRAYENDVLTAITQTGGLPGLDAYNSIIVFKGGMSAKGLTQTLEQLTPGTDPIAACGWGKAISIPLRACPGAPLPFGPEDVVLEPGDVVFIEARVTELFYTGGLLPAGEYVLPRDYDLDVVEAVTFVKGTSVNGAFIGNVMAGGIINRGIGNPNPSLLTVIRKLPGGGQVPIRVDLNKAMRDSRERLIIAPSDVLVLQETAGEAVARYFTQTFNFNSVTNVWKGSTGTGTLNSNNP